MNISRRQHFDAVPRFINYLRKSLIFHENKKRVCTQKEKLII